MKRIGLDLTEEEHKEIKIFCANYSISIREFCMNSIKEKMEKMCPEQKKSHSR